ncbi:unnamed protein product [Natator depressus]
MCTAKDTILQHAQRELACMVHVRTHQRDRPTPFDTLRFRTTLLAVLEKINLKQSLNAKQERGSLFNFKALRLVGMNVQLELKLRLDCEHWSSKKTLEETSGRKCSIEKTGIPRLPRPLQ